MLHDSFMSRPNIIVVPRKMELCDADQPHAAEP